jgi:hypothetical protein
MNEDRLVTLILWVVLALGTASLVAAYFVRSERLVVEPHPSSTKQTEAKLPDTIARRTPSSPVPPSRDAAELLQDRPTKELPTTTPPSPSPQAVIYETSNPNGTFYRAQDITGGVIIGKRGTARDRADYYRVRAAGYAMTLGLEPSLKESKNRFVMSVFDADRRLIEEDLGKTSPTRTLAVTPQATYYIKLDLNHAPIETPQYQLYVHFK